MDDYELLISDYSGLNFLYEEENNVELTALLEEKIIKDGLQAYIRDNKAEYDQMQNAFLFARVMLYGLFSLLSLTALSSIINTLSASFTERSKEFAMLRSVGMSGDSFRKMIHFEAYFYILKALAYGLPLGGLLIYVMHKEIGEKFDFVFSIPWNAVIIIAVAVAIIIFLVLAISKKAINRQNIIETLKSDF